MADRTAKTRVQGPGLGSRPKGPLVRGNKQVNVGLDSLLRGEGNAVLGRRWSECLGKVLGVRGSLGFQRTRVGCLG